MCVCFCFWDKRVYFWLGDYQESNFDCLISYDEYMSDNMEVTRLISICEEAMLSEGLVFLLGGSYENMIIWKYYLFMDFLWIVVITFVPGSRHYPIPNSKHIRWC